MPDRRCLDCGRITTATRCDLCTKRKNNIRNAARNHYAGDWKATRSKVLREWVALNGMVCPGWKRPPHPAVDLTVDHVLARSRSSGLSVLCRSCNASKGAS